MKLILSLLLTLAAGLAHAGDYINQFTLADAVTSNSTQTAQRFGTGTKVFTSTVAVTSGSGSATVTVQVSIDDVTFVDVGTMTPTNTAPGKIYVTAPWPYIRTVVSSISGTGAAVTVKAAY